MKKFLIKLLFFVFLLQIPFLIEAFLPYDALLGPVLEKRYTSIYGKHFPNTKTFFSEKGNLSYGTDLGTTKNYTVVVDDLGLRNNSVIKKPDLVLIGDSQIFCATINQDKILSNQIMAQTPWKVYNANTSTPDAFVQLMHDGVISKPKWVVYERVEKEIPDFYYSINPRTGFLAEVLNFCAQDKNCQWLTNFVSKYARQHGKEFLRTEFFGRTVFPKAKDGSGFFFHDGGNAPVKINAERMEELTNDIVKTKDYFEGKGINFAFMPFPNKETIYWESVPLSKQPTFLFDFVRILQKKGVRVVPSLQFLMEKRHPYLYHKDDTHWNERGVKIVAKEIVSFINSEEQKINNKE